MRVLSTLLTSLALPVVVHGFQVLTLPPIANAASMTMTINTKSEHSQIRQRPNANKFAPLKYTNDVNAMDAKAIQIPLQVNGGSASVATISKTNDALQYAAKAIPLLAAAAAAAVMITTWLSGFS
jgi:hypothetical protein